MILSCAGNCIRGMYVHYMRVVFGFVGDFAGNFGEFLIFNDFFKRYKRYNIPHAFFVITLIEISDVFLHDVY